MIRRQPLALLATSFVLLGCQRSQAEGTAPSSVTAAPSVLASETTAVPQPAQPAPPTVASTNPAPVQPRMGALDHDVYILERPVQGSAEIGAIDLGGSVALRGAEPVSRTGCELGWFAVEPEGFVCLDRRSTLEVDTHPLMVAARGRRGRFERAAPFAWGESRGVAPLYKKIPTQKEQKRIEPRLDKHLAALEKLRAARRAGASEQEVPTPQALESVDIFPAKAEPPAFLAHGALTPWADVHMPNDARPSYRTVPRRSTIAWTDEFFADGRSWLLTPELLLVPKDRVSLRPAASFAGVLLDGDKARLPLAFIRGEPRPKYRLEGDESANAAAQEPGDVVPAAWVAGSEIADEPDNSPGTFVETGESWERLLWVGLTGRARWKRGKRYLQTRERGIWMRDSDATVVGGSRPTGVELKPGDKWMDVSIYWGTLVAYEGERPVFATLISPGLRGYKRVKGKPAKNTTPTGTYRIEWKHLSTTMSPDPETMSYYLSEVPFTQFFHMPFALHGVYWHGDFGEPKSGGCVNLSVGDAKWLFGWTEPALPEGWHSVRSGGRRGPGTWVRVR